MGYLINYPLKFGLQAYCVGPSYQTVMHQWSNEKSDYLKEVKRVNICKCDCENAGKYSYFHKIFI